MTAKEIGRWGSEGQEGRKRTTWKNTLKVYFKLPLTLYPFFAIYSFMLSGISLMEDRNKLILHKLQPRPKANFVLLRPAQWTLQGRRWGTGLPLGLLFTAVSLWVLRLRWWKFNDKTFWLSHTEVKTWPRFRHFHSGEEAGNHLLM